MDGSRAAWVAYAALTLALLTVLAPLSAAGAVATHGPADHGQTATTDSRTATGTPGPDSPCLGTVEEPADSLTVVALQGYVNKEEYRTVGLAKLVALGPEGEIRWVHRSRGNEFWFYDVDPTADGTLFVTASIRNGTTRLFELDPTTGERVWSTVLPYHDTHDADLVDNGSTIVLANMRNNVNNRSHDRVVAIDRNGTELWDWQFRNHFRHSIDSNVTSDDWTHLNDVEHIGGDRYLASPRDFDQVVAFDRASGEVLYRLGEDGDYDTLFEQHNPDYIESPSGNPTLLVSDSQNDRAIEYALRGGEWERTWAATGVEWPRDADRLPDGNTVMAVSGGHRVVEVTPSGEVVWEVVLPGSPYDVERVAFGDESSDDPMAERPASGPVTVHGGDGQPSISRLKRCQARLENATTLAEFVERANTSDSVTPWPGPSTATESTGPTSADGGPNGPDEGSGGETTATSSGTGPTPLGALLGVVALCLALAAVGLRWRR